jgi:hypothetical protein
MSDDGTADPQLLAALAAYDDTPPARARLLAALVDARVFVPITATATAEETAVVTGLRAESTAELALVSLVAADGERAVPAFLDPASLQRWRLDVRPVPVGVRQLAGAVLADGAAALLLEPARAGVVVDRAELSAIAAGYVPVAGAPLATRQAPQPTAPGTAPDPALVHALVAALRPERLRAARLLDGPAGPVLGVAPRRPLDPAALTALAARVRTRLGPALPADGLDLAVVPAHGPGHRIVGRRWR